MLRWLVRLLVLAGIAVAAAMVVSRLTNRDEDFDDYDDLDAGFDFQETPVEIEVPAKQSDGGSSESAQAGGGSATAPSASSADSASTSGDAAKANTNTNTSTNTDANTGANGSGDSSSMETTRLSSGDNLTDIVGIGPAFDARLKAIGINNLADLSKADANSLSEQLDVIGGVTTIEDWIAQAKSATSEEASDGHE